MDSGWTYYSAHFAVYTNVESLCRTPETNIMCVSSILKKTNLSRSQTLGVSNLDKAQWDGLFLLHDIWSFSWGDLKLGSAGTVDQNTCSWPLHGVWASTRHGGLWNLGLPPW